MARHAGEAGSDDRVSPAAGERAVASSAGRRAPSSSRATSEHARIDARDRRALLDWYRATRRALPWRGAVSAYAVMVSEVMLQQTRVEVVLRYYEPFLAAFPDLASLAAAPIDAVLARWSGLGYYRRARRLHEAARAIVERGGFPRTRSELLSLPGIGEYTAAAIASIAFGEAVPVVDGNVERVMARLLDLDVDPAGADARRRIRAAAGLLVDEAAPGDSNQALMELGAMVCRSGRPRCLLCPLAASCAGRASGRAELLPVRRRARAGVRERRVVVVARRAERVLLVRNADADELLAGIWELPWTPRASTRAQWEVGLALRYGGVWSVGARRGAARHGITFRTIDLDVHDADVTFDADSVAESRSGEPRWVAPEEISTLATTSMVRKVLACLESSSRGAVASGRASVARLQSGGEDAGVAEEPSRSTRSRT